MDHEVGQEGGEFCEQEGIMPYGRQAVASMDDRSAASKNCARRGTFACRCLFRVVQLVLMADRKHAHDIKVGDEPVQR